MLLPSHIVMASTAVSEPTSSSRWENPAPPGTITTRTSITLRQRTNTSKTSPAIGKESPGECSRCLMYNG